MFFGEYQTKSAQETLDLGNRLGKNLSFPCSILLYGEMGQGKTLISKGIVQGMGISEDVLSPTYTLVNAYGDPPKIYHFDLYRLQDEAEMYEMGFEDYLNQGAVLLLEWPDLAKDYFLDPKLEIFIKGKPEAPNHRDICFKTEQEEIGMLLNKI